jgi:hypothetical protein
MGEIEHGDLIGSNYEQARLATENAHLRKSAANSDRDYWFEEAKRLTEQLQAAVEAIRRAPHAWHCDARSPMWPGPCSCWKREWLGPDAA